jgi:eukaryotic-like serine/threonine-protein kinase
LLDFGIAKATHQASSTTETGEIKGKFSYMAPEQILGNEVDRRCDVFASGIVLYWLATGKHPFKQHNTAAVIHAITTEEPVPPPSTLVQDFPLELERVLLKALEKDREKRFATAEEMRVALEQAIPEAFGDTGRAALRAFMERAVGDRKLARREAVRRAQVAADASELGSGARAALQAAPSQSVSSLRAIAISQPAPEDAPQLISAATTGEHTPEVPPPRRASRAPWIAAALGLLLAIGATLPRLLSAPERSAAGNHAGVEAGTPLATREALSQARPTTTATATVSTPPLTAPSQPTAEAALIPTAAESPKKHPARAATKAKGAPAKSTAKAASGPSDLIAPDYAR